MSPLPSRPPFLIPGGRHGLGGTWLRTFSEEVPAPVLPRVLPPHVLSLFPQVVGRPLEPVSSVQLSLGTQGHFLLVSTPATWYILASVLGGDVGGGGREERASPAGGDKVSQHATVEPASPSPLPFYMQGNRPRQQRPLAQGHVAC